MIKHEARIGREEEVLIEGPSKKNPGLISGRTRQNKLVHFPRTEPLRAGSYATVLVTGAAPHHLRGEFRELISEPAHKVRIPVAAL